MGLMEEVTAISGRYPGALAPAAVRKRGCWTVLYGARGRVSATKPKPRLPLLAMEEARPRIIGGIIGGIRRREAYDQTKHAKKKPAVAGSVVVEVSGLEPLTPYMRKVEDEKEEPPPLSDDDQDRADGKRRS